MVSLKNNLFLSEQRFKKLFLVNKKVVAQNSYYFFILRETF